MNDKDEGRVSTPPLTHVHVFLLIESGALDCDGFAVERSDMDPAALASIVDGSGDGETCGVPIDRDD